LAAAAAAGGVRLMAYEDPEAGDVDITQQDVLVAVGRGLQGEANLDLAEELAEVLGGAVAGSRPAIDMGWLPVTRQVGKSGMQVKPRLYVALGISGAPEHVEGMKGSGLIVAVNTDPGAPIFNVAQYGAAEDLLEVVPALIDKLKERKGA
jgi:electron transfer flavoprotein alpha subunit